MSIELDCPRCQNFLTISEDRAGSYISCPHCRRTLWVPDSSSENPKRGEPSRPSVETPVTPPEKPRKEKKPKRVAPKVTKPEAPAPAADRKKSTPTPDAKSPQPAEKPDQKVARTKPAAEPKKKPKSKSVTRRRSSKVARFISPDTAKSSVNLAEDGQLPELALDDGSPIAEEEKQQKSSSNPMVMIGVLCFSMLASVLLLFYEPTDDIASGSSTSAEARALIAKEYFSELDSPEPQQPYQLDLRDAQRAHSRGDYATERMLYRKVLSMLRAERTAEHWQWVTGTKERDQVLEEQITILLSGN